MQDSKIGKNQAFWKLFEKEMSCLVLIMFTNVYFYSLVSVISSHSDHVFNFARSTQIIDGVIKKYYSSFCIDQCTLYFIPSKFSIFMVLQVSQVSRDIVN